MAQNKENKENKGNKRIDEQAEEIRGELDSLIGENEESLNVEKDPEDASQLTEQESSLPPANYGKLKDTATRKAEKTIDSLLKFYLDQDIIDNDEYVQAKRNMDVMTMSSLIYQLQAGERALTTLLESIDNGEVTARMFEVLGTLQKSMLDIIKSQNMYLMSAEESTKRIARDAEIYHQRSATQQQENKNINSSGGASQNENIQKGTKALLSKIQEAQKEQKEEKEDSNVQDVEPEENEKKASTSGSDKKNE
jgi:hypothetical protein